MALHRCNIHHDAYIHWNIDIKPTALHNESISIAIYIHWNTGTTPTTLRIRIFVIGNGLIRDIDMVDNQR